MKLTPDERAVLEKANADGYPPPPASDGKARAVLWRVYKRRLVAFDDAAKLYRITDKGKWALGENAPELEDEEQA